MASRRAPKRRSKATRSSSQRTAASKKKKRSPKRKAPKRKAPKRKAPKRKAAKRKAAKRKTLKKPRKLIAPRKKPPKPTEKIPDIREIMSGKREVQREEPTFPDREERSDAWKHIDPFEDFERTAFEGGVFDEDEDAPIIDPDGDPGELPGFEPFQDLPPSVDVHDYIAWLHEAYDLDIGELYEMYFGDADT